MSEPTPSETREHELHERRDPLQGIVWALVLIWAGIVFLASNLGMLQALVPTQVLPPAFAFFQPSAWMLIALGAGVLLLIEIILRILIPSLRQPLFGRFILAILLIGAGLGNLFNWNLFWPLILIAIGVSIIFRGAGKW